MHPQNETAYKKNLNTVAELYLKNDKIPESILVKLIPESYSEFSIFYATTGPEHELGNTDFFYDITQQIFNQVIISKNNDFYIPCLNLASFADGEYAEGFIENLEVIINMDQERFCSSVREIKLRNRNPIKYFTELHDCK